MKYLVKNVTNDFDLTEQQKTIFTDIANDLALVKQNVPFLDDIVIRAGFVLDTLLGVPPHDIDALYSTKEQMSGLFQKCRCDEIRKIISDLDFKVFNKKYDLDLGHFGEGEIYVPILQKAVGFHSHLIDHADMVCINSKGEIWGNEEALYCIKNKIHEIRYDGWLLFSYFIKEFPYTDYYYFCTHNILRGLKMIYTKTYKGVGPNFLTLLENCEPILNYTSGVAKYRKSLRSYYDKKCNSMSIEDIRNSLAVTGASNQEFVANTLGNMLFY